MHSTKNAKTCFYMQFEVNFRGRSKSYWRKDINGIVVCFWVSSLGRGGLDATRRPPGGVTRHWKVYHFQSGRESIVHVQVRPTALLLWHLSSPGLVDPNCERQVRALSGRYTDALGMTYGSAVELGCRRPWAEGGWRWVGYAWVLMLGLGAGACRTYDM